MTIAGLSHKIDSLEKEIAEIKEAEHRQGAFVKWLIGILVAVGMTISGVAYSAHGQLADRLIEVTRLTEAQLARIEERLVAQQRLLEHVFEQGK